MLSCMCWQAVKATSPPACLLCNAMWDVCRRWEGVGDPLEELHEAGIANHGCSKGDAAGVSSGALEGCPGGSQSGNTAAFAVACAQNPPGCGSTCIPPCTCQWTREQQGC